MAYTYGSVVPYGEGLYKGLPTISGETDLGTCYENGTLCDGPDFKCNKINNITGTMMRFAFDKAQGQGWSFYENGEHLVWPEIRPISVVAENDQLLKFAIDELTGQIYEIQTRDGPLSSDVERTFVDKEGEYGGHEIPTEIRFREDVAAEDHKQLENREKHFSIRPHDEEMKGTTGHTAQGFRNAFENNISTLINGEIETEEAITKDIPLNGDIVYDKKVRARRQQTKFYTTTSSYKLVKRIEYYDVNDERGTVEERTMKESEWQDEMFDPVFWLTRNKSLLTDQATGVACGGSYFDEITGPDGNSESAMSFAATTGLTFTLPDLADDFSFMFWFSGIIGTTELFNLGGLRITVSVSGTDYYLELTDGTNVVSQLLGFKGGGWDSIQIVREGTFFIIRENGNALNTFAIVSVLTYTGASTILDSAIGNLFDIRVYDEAVSASAYEYYHYNVMNQNGDAVMPLF